MMHEVLVNHGKISNNRLKPDKMVSAYNKRSLLAFRFIPLIGSYLLGYHQLSILWVLFPSTILWYGLYPKNAAMQRFWSNKEKAFNGYINNNGNSMDNYETVDWLNRTLQHLWPILDRSANGWITKRLQKWGQSKYGEGNFQLNTASLGCCPPYISQIIVDHVRNKKLVVDFDLSWESDSHVEFSVSMINIITSMKNLCVKGVARIILCPIEDSIERSSFEAAEVFFVEPPEVSFDLTGVANILDSLGIIDLQKNGSEYIGSIKLVIKSVEQKLLLEVRKKSTTDSTAVTEFITQMTQIMADTSEIDIDVGNSGMSIYSPGETFDPTSPEADVSDLAESICDNGAIIGYCGEIKLGIVYNSTEGCLIITIFEGKNLNRIPSQDLPDPQVKIDFGPTGEKVWYLLFNFISIYIYIYIVSCLLLQRL